MVEDRIPNTTSQVDLTVWKEDYYDWVQETPVDPYKVSDMDTLSALENDRNLAITSSAVVEASEST